MKYNLDDLGAIAPVPGSTETVIYWKNQPEGDDYHIYCSHCGWVDPANPEEIKDEL